MTMAPHATTDNSEAPLSPSSRLPPPRRSPPPNMPLPALPNTKKRLPETPKSTEEGRGPSTAIPTPNGPALRKITPSGLARLRMPAVQSSTNLSTPPIHSTLGDTIQSADGTVRDPDWSTRRSFRKTVSIGSFPQPPKGGFGNPSLAASPNSSPRLPSTPENGLSQAKAAPTSRLVSPLITSVHRIEASNRRASETKIAGNLSHLVDEPERRSSEPFVPATEVPAPKPTLARGSSLPTSSSGERNQEQMSDRGSTPVVGKNNAFATRTSSLPTTGKRSVSAATGIPKAERFLNVPPPADSRPGSSHGSITTDGTQFEDVDPPTPTRGAGTRLSHTGSVRSLRSVKSVGTLRDKRSSLIMEEEEIGEGLKSTRLSSSFRPRPKARASDAPSIRSVRSSKSTGTLRDSFTKDGRGNVVVSVRVRPNNNSSSPDPSASTGEWNVEGKQSLISYRAGEGGEFRYDNVFTANDDNSRVYDSSAKRLVRRVMEGYHGTVFAYGITGTGKTFSMQGTAQSPGIIPLAITDIFSYIREHPSREFLLRVSYLEIYNEKIFDLLSPNEGGLQEEIKLREDSKRGVYAYPLKEEIVQSPTQLLRVIARGDMARRTGSTQFNVRSSRSHAVVQIVVESRERAAGRSSGRGELPNGVLVSTLSLIDLAGSERAAEDKDRRTEGSHINKSLLTLGTVVGKLAGSKDGKGGDNKHLPYRDSKLTRLLQSALSGGALISILCTIQISPLNQSGLSSAMAGPTETLNTLKFASRAKNNIVSHAKKNESLPGVGGEARALLDRYKAEIEELRKQLEEQQGQTKVEPVRTEEEEERWMEREREAAERHEEQLLEMQLARTALKERIGHLNRLILSSKSAGVNSTHRAIPQAIKDKRQPGPDEVGVALGSPEASRNSSIASPALVDGVAAPSTRPSMSRAVSLNSVAGTRPRTGVAEENDDDYGDDASTESGEASLLSQNRALQADLADKNRYIATLERRLLEARRTSHSHVRPRRSLPGGGDDAVAEKDREIAELKARLDDQTKMVQALRSAARRREMVDIRSSPGTPSTPAAGTSSPVTAPTPTPTPAPQSLPKPASAGQPAAATVQPLRTANKERTSSPVEGLKSPLRHKRSGDAAAGAKTTSMSSQRSGGHKSHKSQLSVSSQRSVNFSRLTPVAILDGGRSRAFSDSSRAGAEDSNGGVGGTSRSAGGLGNGGSGGGSLDEMTALLDGMIQAKARDDHVAMRFGGSMMLRESAVAPLMVGDMR